VPMHNEEDHRQIVEWFRATYDSFGLVGDEITALGLRFKRHWGGFETPYLPTTFIYA
jgi:hypothetical protein